MRRLITFGASMQPRPLLRLRASQAFRVRRVPRQKRTMFGIEQDRFLT